MTRRLALSVSSLALCAGSSIALAQAPTVDGVKDAAYGSAKWVNTQNPTGFGDSGNQNPCDPLAPGGDGAAVTTGIEFAIPLSRIGNPAGAIRLMAAVNGGGHDYFSNQFIPGLPGGTGNLGGDGSGGFNGTVGAINMTNYAGTQHAEANPGLSIVAPTMDGVLDAAIYGAAIAVQGNRTGFGNASAGNAATANGSEMDALYVARDANNLYVFIAGNIESNFNKLELFIDSVEGGQNVVAAGNPDVDFGALNKFVGFTFDAGFTADYYLTFGLGGDTNFYPNFVDMGSTGAPYGAYLGCNQAGTGSGTIGANCGGDQSIGIQIAINNSNTAGVAGGCPPPAGSRDSAAGSEIDAVYSYIDGTDLYIFVSGNLETGGGSPTSNDGNKLTLFIDASEGGQNRMLGTNVDISFGNLNRLGDDGTGNGLTFDTGFSADYWLQYKNVGAVGSVSHVVDAAVLRTEGRRIVPFLGGSLDYGAYYGGPKADAQYRPATFNGNSAVLPAGSIDPGEQDGTATNIYCNFAPRLTAESLVEGQTPPYTIPLNPPVGAAGKITFDMNNANIAGVSGDSANGADAVNTGFEIRIDLTELGYNGTGGIRLAGFVGNNDNSFLSNQVIGGLPAGAGNLGGDPRTFVFGNIDGTQHITLVAGDNACPVDFNGDGNIDPDDLADYIACYFTPPCAQSDFNGDGNSDPDDLSDYIAAYFGPLQPGC